jgi:hypothetical protein
MINMREEYRRCFQDKTGRYFIEHYLSTFNADVVKETPFILFPRQLAFLKSLRDNPNTIAIKHRQAGITTVSSGWATYKCVFADKKAPETILCIGNKLDTSQQLIEKMGAFLDQVPRWMWGSEFYHPDPDNEKNKKSIYVARNKQKLELFNGCKIYARSSGKHAARGISAVSILIFDEAAMIENGPEVYSQAVACTATLGSKARIIMISTPKGKDQLYYKTYDKALKGENNYTPVEFKWFQDPRYNRSLEWHRKNEDNGEDEVFKEPTIGSRGEIEYNEEHWRSMEREGWKPTSPWYLTMCATFNQDQMLIDQELNVSFLGSSDNVVPVDTIEAQRDQNNVEITENWPFCDPMIKETWIWKPPIEGHRYILGCDNSSGSADDFTALQILDVDAIDEETNTPYIDQVLEYNGKITGEVAGQIINQYAHTYNDALVVVEDIGGYGSATILALLGMKYPNLYYDDPGLKTPTIMKKYVDYKINKDGKLPGFHTSNVRFQMIAKFVELLKNNGLRIRSKRVINELETWVFKNGRPDHMDGFHDDLLTCLSMVVYVMEYSLLRNELQKKKDSAMLGAWFMNNKRFEDSYTRKMKEKVYASQDTHRAFNPFITRRDIDDKKVLNGCIMLGGFSIKK